MGKEREVDPGNPETRKLQKYSKNGIPVGTSSMSKNLSKLLKACYKK